MLATNKFCGIYTNDLEEKILHKQGRPTTKKVETKFKVLLKVKLVYVMYMNNSEIFISVEGSYEFGIVTWPTKLQVLMMIYVERSIEMMADQH